MDSSCDPNCANTATRASGVLDAPSHPQFWLAPLVAWGSLLALYVATLAPSITGGDSGELTAAALSGGVPHPPGYPLFALLARALAALPLGHSPAWRVNLLSAISTSVAAGLLCAVVQLWTRSRAAGLVSAAIFGTNEVVWVHATAAEVFGLNALFAALALLLWLTAERMHSRRFVFALAFVTGLALCNHHTFVFIGLPLLLRTLWIARRDLNLRSSCIALGLGLLGLTPYAYLAIATNSSAEVSWGDLTTLGGWLDHVLRRSYGTFSLGRSLDSQGFVENGNFYGSLYTLLGEASQRSAWMCPGLAFAGLYYNVKSRDQQKTLLTLCTVLAAYVLAFCALSNLSPASPVYRTVASRFCIQLDLMLAALAGLGFAELNVRWLTSRVPLFAGKPQLLYAFPALACLIGVKAHVDQDDQHRNRIFADFAGTVVRSLPPHSVLITVGDHISGAVEYVLGVERLRPDVIQLDRGLLGSAWYRRRKQHLHLGLTLPAGAYGPHGWGVKQLLAANPSTPIAVIDSLDDWDTSWSQKYKVVTRGWVHLLVPATESLPFEQWAQQDRQAMGHFSVIPALQSPEGSWELAVGQLALNMQALRANIALQYGVNGQNQPGAPRLCVELLEDVIAKSGGDARLGIAGQPGPHPFSAGAPVWKDLGICYEQLARVDRSYRVRVALAVQRFAEHAAFDDPALPAARKYLRTHPVDPVAQR